METVTVVYKGSCRTSFKTDATSSWTGGCNGVFIAVPDTLVTKCPSKYAPKR
jgi:hypothetical protein